MGIVFGLALTALDYLACGRTQAPCPWAALTNRISYAYDSLVHHLGHVFGVHYGYVPYFPSRATQVFLAIVALTLPWASWFLLGIIVRAVVRMVRPRTTVHDQRLQAN